MQSHGLALEVARTRGTSVGAVLVFSVFRKTDSDDKNLVKPLLSLDFLLFILYCCLQAKKALLRIKSLAFQPPISIIVCMSAYSPSLVANAFLYKARQSGAQITHMKLQKLVFFMHAWSLATTGASAVTERPEAWTYGPVFESLYHELKTFGSRGIDAYLTQMNAQTGERQAQIPVLSDTAFWGLLEQVWERYSPLSAMELSALTHEAGSPWEVARNAKTGWLTDESIRSYYGAQLQGVH